MTMNANLSTELPLDNLWNRKSDEMIPLLLGQSILVVTSCGQQFAGSFYGVCASKESFFTHGGAYLCVKTSATEASMIWARDIVEVYLKHDSNDKGNS
jgi:hypothetical protein